MTNIDRIRFAHWIDLHELDHIGIDSETMWHEIEALEALNETVPQMPAVGDTVTVKYLGSTLTGEVVWVSNNGCFTISPGYPEFEEFAFTLCDLIDIDQDDQSPAP